MGPTAARRFAGMLRRSYRRPLARSFTAFALLAVVVGVVLSAVPGTPKAKFRPGMVLAAGTGFTLSGSVSGLAPGAAPQLPITASNILQGSTITVTSITVTLSSISPVSTTTTTAPCSATNLSVAGHTFTGLNDSVNSSSDVHFAPTTVKAQQSGVSVWSPTISVASGAPNACQLTAFNFSYSGTATFTDGTATNLATPTVNANNMVTLTATVTANNASYDDSQPYQESSPGNTVQFDSCPNGSGCTYIGTGTLNPSGVATFMTGVEPAGMYYFQAIYPGAGTAPGLDFDTSTSAMQSAVVTTSSGSTACVNITSAPTTTIGPGQTYQGNLNIANGQTVSLNGGTINGNVTVAAGGQFLASGGAVNGNLSSAGAVEIQGTTVSGNVTSTGGGLSVQSGATLNHDVNVSGSGPVCLVGTTSSHVVVQGHVTIQNLAPSATQNSLCGLTAAEDVVYNNNAEPVQIGGSVACPGNSLAENLTVQGNSAALTIGSGQAALGPVTHANLYGVAVNDPAHAATVGAGGVVFDYGPGGPPPGSTWTSGSSGTTNDLRAVSALDPNHLWAVGVSCTLLYSADRGNTWTPDSSPSGCTTTLRGVFASDPNHVWAVGDNGTIVNCTSKCDKATASWALLMGGNVPPATINFSGIWGTGNTVYAVGTYGTGAGAMTGNGAIWACSANCNVTPAGPQKPPAPPAFSTWTDVTPPATVLPAGTALNGVNSSNNATIVVGANGTVLVCSAKPPCTSASWAKLSGAAAPGTLVPGVSLTSVWSTDHNNVLAAGNLNGNGYIFGCSAACSSATAISGPAPPSPPPPPPGPSGSAVWAQVYASTNATTTLNSVGSAGGPAGPGWAVGNGGVILSCSSNCDKSGAVWTVYTQPFASATGNTVLGNLTVQNNTNTAGSQLQGNYVDGNCTLAGDSPSPGIPGTHNIVTGKQNTCNGTA